LIASRRSSASGCDQRPIVIGSQTRRTCFSDRTDPRPTAL
jgi:hypothetical protein